MSRRPFIQAATTDDVEAVLDLLAVAAEHGEFAFGEFDRNTARLAVEDCIKSGAVLMSMSNGAPVATMGFEVAGVWWSKIQVMREYWVFVHPEHRRAPHARSMLQAAKDVAREARLPFICGVLSTKRTAGKVRLFQREFGVPVGATFLVAGG